MPEVKQEDSVNQANPEIFNKVAKIFKGFTNPLDPVKNCELYLKEGCSHVDGMLCDFPDCEMNKILKPKNQCQRKQKESVMRSPLKTKTVNSELQHSMCMQDFSARINRKRSTCLRTTNLPEPKKEPPKTKRTCR